MLAVQSTCGLDCRREHGVQANYRRVDLVDEIDDLTVVCKMGFLVPRCNEDLDVFCESLDTFDTWRLDGTDLSIFVRCKMVVVIESFVERCSVQRMENDVFGSRLMLLRKC